MASLKRDTPAGRAALARRRQRAAAVVDNSTRFVEGSLGEFESQDSSSNSPPMSVPVPVPVSSFPNEQEQSSRQPSRGRASQPDPPPQQQHLQYRPSQTQQQQQQQQQQQTPTESKASYSTAALPSSDELLQRSSEVAQAAASVLASARKSKQPQRRYVYNTSANNNANYLNTTSSAKTTSGSYNRYLNSDANTSFSSSQQQQQQQHQKQQQRQSQQYQTPGTAFHQMGRSSSDYPAPAAHTTGTSKWHHHQTTTTTPTTPEAPVVARTRMTQESSRRSDFQRLPVDTEEVEDETQGHQNNSSSNYYLNSGHHHHDDENDNDDDDDDDDHNVEYHNNNNDDEVTAEELEPVLLTSQQDELLDAATINSGTWIMLRSMAVSATVTTTTEDDPLARMHGAGLGTLEEILKIVKLQQQSTAAAEEEEEEVEGRGGPELRWGDTVTLLSPLHFEQQQPKALGIRKRNPQQANTNNTVEYQIGWFRHTMGQSETWTILRSSSRCHCVRVGLAAPRATKLLAEKRAVRGERTHTVKSGDPILLRHNQTGGLLSVNASSGELHLVTDSYDSNSLRPHNASTSLMGQLQQHGRYYPLDKDMFALVKSSVPPCPRWVLGGGTSSSSNQTYNPSGHRMFLHHTYLHEPNRNILEPDLQEKLFGRQWSSLARMHQQKPDATQQQQPLDLTEQEGILLDEVIGACLGLEGQYVRVNHSEQNGDVGSTDKIEFILNNDHHQIFDTSLRNLVQRILPLASLYARVRAFVSAHLPGYEYGSVMQAFCEALDMLMQEYASFMAEVEQQFRHPQGHNHSLTLRKLYAQVLSSLHTMSILEKSTIAAFDKTGGSLLNALATLKAWSCEGDLVANKVLCILLDKASVPYMTMMTTWLQHGLLRDPYNEFMIEICDQKPDAQSPQLKHSADSNFNNETYLIRGEHILTGLVTTEAMLQKVVATGKYWRAVRACEVAAALKKGDSDDNTSRSRHNEWEQQPNTVLHYGLDFSTTTSFIQSLYEKASRALVSLLMTDFNFMDALRSMKQYFLLEHGDFLVHFLDSAEDELLKELGDVSSGRVQHWLRMSVQVTEDHATRRRDTSSPHERHQSQQRSLSPLSLRCRFQPISLIDHVKSLNLIREGGEAPGNVDLTRDEGYMATPSRDAYGLSKKGLSGVETFMLDFPSVPFPMSLVLSAGALESYQLLFRLLFLAKYVERRLVKIWQDHQAMKELNSIRGLFGPTFLLRQRMLHFAQNLIYYIMFEVIEPNWLEMEEAIGNPGGARRRTVDDIVEVHDAFLNKTLAACLLTDKDLVRTLTRLMTTCLMFSDQMKIFTEATMIHDDNTHIAAERRNAIQRSLNDRGGAGRGPVDKQVLREAINSFRQERQTRVKDQKHRVGLELSSGSYRGMVTRFDEVFSAFLSDFMLQLNSDASTMYGSHKSNLYIRLDYNGFLSSAFVIDDGRLA